MRKGVRGEKIWFFSSSFVCANIVQINRIADGVLTLYVNGIFVFLLSLLGLSLCARASDDWCPVHVNGENNTFISSFCFIPSIHAEVEHRKWSFTVNFISLTLMVHAREIFAWDIFYIIVRETASKRGRGKMQSKLWQDSNKFKWSVCVFCRTAEFS